MQLKEHTLFYFCAPNIPSSEPYNMQSHSNSKMEPPRRGQSTAKTPGMQTRGVPSTAFVACIGFSGGHVSKHFWTQNALLDGLVFWDGSSKPIPNARLFFSFFQGVGVIWLNSETFIFGLSPFAFPVDVSLLERGAWGKWRSILDPHQIYTHRERHTLPLTSPNACQHTFVWSCHR